MTTVPSVPPLGATPTGTPTGTPTSTRTGTPGGAATPAAGASSAAGTDFIYLAQLVRQHSAIVVDPAKEYLFTSRLTALSREHALDGIPGLVTALRRQPYGPLKDAVIEAMTTNETSFFRDQAPFEAFRSILTDTITVAGTGAGTVRVWSAACSSGQEPYSIALTAREMLSRHPGWRVNILATDISKAMVERTKAGRFTSMEINRGLPATRLVTDFTQVGRDWEASPALRSMIETRVLNLDAALPPLPRMDVVFLRNVLIYFDPATKEQVLGRVAGVLRPGGYLFLGGAETTLGLDTPFERTTVGRTPVYRLTS